jgi:hypothetical protein
MTSLKYIFAPAIFLAALSFAQPVHAKACEQLTGGACKGHWECTTDEGSSGYCNDDGAKDCYCKKGPKSKQHSGFSFGMGMTGGGSGHHTEQQQPTQQGTTSQPH